MKKLFFFAVGLALAGCASYPSLDRDPAATASVHFQCASDSSGKFEWKHVSTAIAAPSEVVGKCGLHSSTCPSPIDENGYEVSCTQATVGKFVISK